MFRKITSKVSKGFKHAGQGMKRFVRSAEESSDPENEATIIKFKDLKHALRETLDQGLKLKETVRLQQAAAELFNEKLSKLEVGSQDVQSFRATSAALVNVEVELYNHFDELVLTPVQRLLNQEIEECRSAVLTYEERHAEFDVATAVLQKAEGEKRDEAQQSLVEATQKFEEAKRQLQATAAAVFREAAQVNLNIGAFNKIRHDVYTQKALQGQNPAAVQPDKAPANAEVKVAPSHTADSYGGPPPLQQQQQQTSTTAPASDSTVVVACYDYDASADDELSFKKGNLIRVDEKVDEGWWKGTIVEGGNGSGLFPANYCKPQ